MHLRTGPEFNCSRGLRISDPGIELGPVPFIRLLFQAQFVVGDPASAVRGNKRQVVASGCQFCDAKVSFIIRRSIACILESSSAVFDLPALRSYSDSLDWLAILVL